MGSPEDEDDVEDEIVMKRSDTDDQVNFKSEPACQNATTIDQTIAFELSDYADAETLAS